MKVLAIKNLTISRFRDFALKGRKDEIFLLLRMRLFFIIIPCYLIDAFFY
jgi:hypothetical protein